MNTQMILLKNYAIRLAFATLLVLTTGMLDLHAQTIQTLQKGKSEIPKEFISSLKFSVLKSDNAILSFDETIPYFTELNIVNIDNKPVNSVVSTNISAADGTIVRREFNFSGVTPGTYYAQGVLTGTLIYYEIDVID